MNSLSEANTKFMFDLLKQFRKSQKNNTFYSPISITTALGMVLLGAKDNTAQQINKVGISFLRCPVAASLCGNVHHQFQKLLTELNKSTDAYELKIANKLFGEKTFQFLQEYLDAIKKLYQTSVESVDFAKAPEESRKKINSWVESQTNGRRAHFEIMSFTLNQNKFFYDEYLKENIRKHLPSPLLIGKQAALR
uniref:Serpin domain-containing protein n=1 Tax=Theropithecus gelada TaxID=9565 RepID=A0A8D2FF12_THEGE